mgnify:CR=1 FL=1
MRFLREIENVTKRDRIQNTVIRKRLKVDSLKEVMKRHIMRVVQVKEKGRRSSEERYKRI